MNYCFYFLAGVLFVSSISVISNTTDDSGVIFGAVMLALALGSGYLGSKIAE